MYSCVLEMVTWMKRHEDVRETEEDLIKQQEEELRRKKALGEGQLND